MKAGKCLISFSNFKMAKILKFMVLNSKVKK